MKIFSLRKFKGMLNMKNESIYDGKKNQPSIQISPKISSSDVIPDPLFSQLGEASVPGIILVAFSSPYLGFSTTFDSMSENKNHMSSQGDDISHGEELLVLFVNGLSDPIFTPDVIVFYHRGVELLSEGNKVIDILFRLSEWGVRVLACKESCERYKIDIPFAWVQKVSMQTICKEMLHADKVIRP